MKVVFDLDGTLADCSHRAHHLQKEPKDWDAWHAECGLDMPNRALGATMRALCYTTWASVEIWTGRSEAVRRKTETWLSVEGINYGAPLRMRLIGDHRPDTELKKAWAEKYGWPDLVFEDRQRVVDMWRAHGVTCCQVAPGDF